MAENFAEKKNHEKERKIPVFSVLKNNSVLKNIFLTEAPSPISPPSLNLSEEKKNGGIKKHGFEEIFVVGRHPDCNIKLEHPSISRFHLRIHSTPSLQSLSVFDLSSVHGTWVCGKRIEPEVEVKLLEGDTLKLGVSSRIYRLHWVPLSGIYDFNNPCLPTIDETEPLEEKEEEEEEEETHNLSLKLGEDMAESEGTRFLSSGYLERHEGETCLCPDDHSDTMNDDLEGLNLMFMNMTLQSKPGTPLSSFKLDCTQSPSLSQEEDVVNSSFKCHEFTHLQAVEKVELEEKKNEDCWAPRSLAFDDDLEGLSFLFTDMNKISQSNQWTSSEYLMPAHEKSPLSYEEEKFDSFTYLQPVSPSAPSTPEGTVDHGGRSSPANKLHQYCVSSATPLPAHEKSPLSYEEEKFDSFTYLQPVSPSAPSTPEGTVDHGGRSSSANKLHQYCVSSATPLPVREKSPLSYEEEKFDSFTYLQPASPSAPSTPEGTVDHGGRSSSANKLHQYCVSSATPLPVREKSPFHNGDEEENNNRLSSGTADTQTISEHAKPNNSLNASSISGKTEPKIPCPSPWSRSGKSIWKRGKSDCVQIQEKLTIGLSSDYFCEREDKAEESIFTPDKENCTSDFLPNRSLQKIDQRKVKCELRVNTLTYSSDGENEEAFTPDKENISPSTQLLRCMKMGMDKAKPKTYRSSPLKNVDPNIQQVVGQSGFSGKGIELQKLLQGRNTARSACRSNKKCELRVNTLTYSSDGENEEAFTPDKENISPSTQLLRCMKMGMDKVKPKTSRSSPLKNVDPNIQQVVCQSGFSGKGIELQKILQGRNTARSSCRSNKKCELRVNTLTYSSDGENEEAFTPDKENISPSTQLLRCMKKMGMDEVKPKTSRSSPLKNVDPNIQQVVGQSGFSGKGIELQKILQGRNTARSACRSNKKCEPEANVSKGSPDKEAPFQFLIVNSGSKDCDASNLDVTTGSCGPMNKPNVNKQPTYHVNAFEEKNKKWTMVVDTACLLDKESRKALQLMQGLPRTNLIIPRMVIQELDLLKRHGSLFRSTKQASDALQWIEDCMLNAQAWIHVQSAMEDTSQIAPTLTPASFSYYSVDKMKLLARHIAPTLTAASFSHFSVDKMKLLAGFLPFYHMEGQSEIVSPTTEDHIIECAIWLRRMGDNGQVVLLSDNISLKIKAMAEGLLSETAKQFRESLVNPFSKRFFWTHSSPRGLTWSCADDVILKNKYYNGSSKKQSKSGEDEQGLKLVLLYNSQFRPISSVN